MSEHENTLQNSQEPTHYVMKQYFSAEEERANAISHGIGAALSILGLVYLLIAAAAKGTAWHVVSFSIYGASLFTLYLSSSMTHGLPESKLKQVFYFMDRIAIYFLIAGTYTPIALTFLRGHGGWLIFGLEWAFAILGVLLLAIKPKRLKKISDSLVLILYVLMGWMILFFMIPALAFIPLPAVLLILGGGVSYTLGILFFNMKNKRYSHLVWHLMVILGSVLHWIAIFGYSMPVAG